MQVKLAELRPCEPYRMATTRRTAEPGSTHLGTRIRTARKDRKMTGQELATAAGVTKGAVSQWEKGNVRNLRLEHLFKVADALRVEPRWLATGEGERSPRGATPAPLDTAEAEAIARLRDSIPDWRKYVLSLTKMEKNQQELILLTMRQTAPAYLVEATVGSQPTHPKHRK